MLDTKEILAKQKPEPQPISIHQLERGPTLTWTIEGIAQGCDFGVRSARHIFSDVRYISPLIEAWLAAHGFDMRSDKKGGWLLTSQNNGATFRVRTCKDSVNLRPPLTKTAGQFDTLAQKKKKEADTIHGWALAFIVDMPNAPIWFISLKMVRVLQEKGFLDDKFTCRKAKWRSLHEFLIQAEAEGAYAGP